VWAASCDVSKPDIGDLFAPVQIEMFQRQPSATNAEEPSIAHPSTTMEAERCECIAAGSYYSQCCIIDICTFPKIERCKPRAVGPNSTQASQSNFCTPAKRLTCEQRRPASAKLL